MQHNERVYIRINFIYRWNYLGYLIVFINGLNSHPGRLALGTLPRRHTKLRRLHSHYGETAYYTNLRFLGMSYTVNKPRNVILQFLLLSWIESRKYSFYSARFCYQTKVYRGAEDIGGLRSKTIAACPFLGVRVWFGVVFDEFDVSFRTVSVLPEKILHLPGICFYARRHIRRRTTHIEIECHRVVKIDQEVLSSI